MNFYPYVYLSPHYDDASLSCGGTIYQQTQAGQPVLVVTIFAAPTPPDEPFSIFAQTMHAKWSNSGDIITARQAEDQTSMTILGADYLRLDFTDCIYRGHPRQGEWFYNNDDELFGPVHPDDLFLAEKVVEAVVELVPPGGIIYAPLGVGHHIDHQLTHTAAWGLRRQGWAVVFYEDYPYADPQSCFATQGREYATLTATLAVQQSARLQPHLHFLSEESLQAKINGVLAYTSQLPVLFDHKTEIANNLRQYALFVGQGRLAERFWQPGGEGKKLLP